MEFEDALAEVGGFGRFQLRTMLLLLVPRMTLPFHFLLNNFIAFVPPHRCNLTLDDDDDDTGAFGKLTPAQRLAVGVPAQADGTPSSCRMFAEPQYHLLLLDASSQDHLLHLDGPSNASDPQTVPCQSGWVYDRSTFKSTLATEWDLVCDHSSMNRASATIFFMGVMLGAVVFGSLSDRYGRKRMLLVAYLTAILFGFASTFSYSFAMFAVLRFFTGIGLSGISIMSIVLCVEWVDIKRRTAVAILISLDWSVFAALLSVVGYLVNDWRYLTAVVTSPLVVAVITWWWLPESARWLMSNGKVEEACVYLRQCAEVNRRGQFMAEHTPEGLSRVTLVGKDGRTYSYLDLVRTPRMRRLALLTGLIWFGVANTYYGISLNVTGFGVNIFLTQFIYGAIELPAKAFVYCSLRKTGRRKTEAGTLILTGICVFSNIFIPKDMWLFRTAVGTLGKGFSEASFAALYLYTAELYPTVMRQNGLGYSSSMARLGVAISPLIMLLEDVWAPLPSGVFCLVAVGAGLLALLLPETRNLRLPETIEDVEQTTEDD